MRDYEGDIATIKETTMDAYDVIEFREEEEYYQEERRAQLVRAAHQVKQAWSLPACKVRSIAFRPRRFC